MTSIFDVDASSDSEDDIDYVPQGEEAADDNSDLSEEVSDDEIVNDKEKLKKRKNDVAKNDVPKQQSDDKTDEKTRANAVWASFLSDVGSGYTKKLPSENPETKVSAKKESSISELSPKINETSVMSENKMASLLSTTAKVNEKDLLPLIKIDTPEVKVQTSSEEINKSPKNDEKIKIPAKRLGLSSLLGGLTNKKSKLTTLEKTKLDWDEFKQNENIDEELRTFNKGKAGFVERQQFLQRSDFRSFEVEKSLRQVSKRK